MSDFKTPKKKVEINEELNEVRIDSGKYPRVQRKINTYKPDDFESFKEDQQREAYKQVQNAIYYKAKDKIPPPPGPQIMEDLRNARDSRKIPWGGKKKSYSKRKKALNVLNVLNAIIQRNTINNYKRFLN